MSVEESVDEPDSLNPKPGLKSNVEISASTPTPTPTVDSIDENHEPNQDGASEAKRPKKGPGPQAGKKPSAEVLKRRKEGRIKAAATIAQNLKKTGIGRFEAQNGFGLTSIKTIPLINQKNYYTDYLKKDEQVNFIRNWRAERLLQQQMKKGLLNQNQKQQVEPENDDKKWDDFNLNDIETEMNKKKADAQAAAEAEAAAAAEVAATQAEDDEEEEDDENETEEVREQKAKIGHDTIIIHPGSAYIRIGRATDAVPITVPNVIAVKGDYQTYSEVPKPLRKVDENGDVHFDEHFEELTEIVTKDFKARMRFYKRRILPNSRETAANYNKKQEPEKIPDHNDPYKKDWLDLNSSKNEKFYVGEEALKLPLGTTENQNHGWIIRYPMINGNFNQNSPSYTSQQEILGDLANIVLDTLKTLEVKNLSHQKAILIIPDLYDKKYVETWVDLLFKLVGFGRVAIIQESVAATFGAGASCACVVDVGAQTTSISCVEDGMIINDSRVLLDYGGDHITETFIKLLLESSLPYKDINLTRRNDDWELAQTLKHNYCTFQDADIAVQLYNFYKRRPNEMTEKYEFKVFDEVMLAPLGLFFPEIFQIGKVESSIPSIASSKDPNPNSNRFFRSSTDQYTGKPNNPQSKSQINLSVKLPYSDQTEDQLLLQLYEQKNSGKDITSRMAESVSHVPLEKAIIESISNAGLATDLAKLGKFYDNLLIVGGGFAKTPGFDLLLSDRINIWRPKILSSDAIESILEYVAQQLKKSDEAKAALIEELKAKKADTVEPGEEVELDEKELEQIEVSAEVELDFEKIESFCEQGTPFSINVLPPPREFDPEMLTWKGGSVYGRLKVVQEMWVTTKDWELLESRCLYYKSLFNY